MLIAPSSFTVRTNFNPLATLFFELSSLTPLIALEMYPVGKDFGRGHFVVLRAFDGSRVVAQLSVSSDVISYPISYALSEEEMRALLPYVVFYLTKYRIPLPTEIFTFI